MDEQRSMIIDEDQRLMKLQQSILSERISKLKDDEKFQPTTVSSLINVVGIKEEEDSHVSETISNIMVLSKANAWDTLLEFMTVSHRTIYSLFMVFLYVNSMEKFGSERQSKFIPHIKLALIHAIFNRTRNFCQITQRDVYSGSKFDDFLINSLDEMEGIRLKIPSDMADPKYELRVVPTGVCVIALALKSPERLTEFQYGGLTSSSIDYTDICGDSIYYLRIIPRIADASKCAKKVLDNIALHAPPVLERLILSCFSFESRKEIHNCLSLVLKNLDKTLLQDYQKGAWQKLRVRRMTTENRKLLLSIHNYLELDQEVFLKLRPIIIDEFKKFSADSESEQTLLLLSTTNTIFSTILLERLIINDPDLRVLTKATIDEFLSTENFVRWDSFIEIILDYMNFGMLNELIDAVRDYKELLEKEHSTMVKF